MYNNIMVAIIAGGKSTRFGQPKSFAQLRNQRLIDHAVNLAKILSSDRVIITGNDLEYADLNIPVITDIIEGCGPIGGLYTALEYSKTDWVLTMPVDMPFLSESIYQLLLNGREGTHPVIAETDEGLEPMVALWHKTSFPVVQSFIDKELYSLRGPLSHLNAIKVYMPVAFSQYKSGFFHNINYRSDLEKSEQIMK